MSDVELLPWTGEGERVTLGWLCTRFAALVDGGMTPIGAVVRATSEVVERARRSPRVLTRSADDEASRLTHVRGPQIVGQEERNSYPLRTPRERGPEAHDEWVSNVEDAMSWELGGSDAFGRFHMGLFGLRSCGACGAEVDVSVRYVTGNGERANDPERPEATDVLKRAHLSGGRGWIGVTCGCYARHSTQVLGAGAAAAIGAVNRQQQSK